MAFANPNVPSLADFLEFLTESVQLPADALAVGSPWPGYAYNIALQTIPIGAAVAAPLYVLAVYNLATHYLFLLAPDNAAATPPDNTYFSTKRKSFGLLSLRVGFATSASDDGTSGSLTLPDWVKGLMPGQMGLAQTTWGMWALQFMADYGPTVWGIS